VLPEALPRRWERGTTIPWRSPVAAHAFSS
jgi:hypothetical protein